MNPNATAQAQERRAEFLRVLAETGSPVQARRAVGVASRTVRQWQEDESFLDRYNDAIEVAQDAIRAKVREMALAGSEPMLSLSMKVIEPALRPASSVNVGVQVNSAAERRIAQLSDEELLERGEAIIRDVQMRALGLPQPAGDVVDAGQGADSLVREKARHGAVDEPQGHIDVDPDSVL